MITFVRILTNNVLHPGVKSQARLKQQEALTEDDSHQENPWRKELDRLARCQQQNAGLPSPHMPAFPRTSRAVKPASVPVVKQGPMTDQKLWWGKALEHRTYSPEELPKMNRIPPKTVNHWQR